MKADRIPAYTRPPAALRFAGDCIMKQAGTAAGSAKPSVPVYRNPDTNFCAAVRAIIDRTIA